MKNDFRCACPISSALDVLGDKWTLVIIKQMLLEGKHTFKDLSTSEEGIASNILASRLKKLESFKLIEKQKHPKNKKVNLYRLTQKGLHLTPILVELTLWGAADLKRFNPQISKDSRISWLKDNKEEGIQMIVKNYKKEFLNLQKA